jgi:hypothetical protein
MGQSLSEKRLAENEVVFKQANMRAVDGIKSVKTIAEEDNQEYLVSGIDDMILQFYCECSNEKCKKRILLSTKEYVKHHQNKAQFITAVDHDNPKIERVVIENDKYIVVEKFITPPENVQKLKPTP